MNKRILTKNAISYLLLLPIISIFTISAMMLAQTMVILRGLYLFVMNMLFLASFVTIPILGCCAVNPQYSFIRPMLVADIASCLFVFPLLIVGYDWVLNKLTGGWVERSRYFRDSPIYHKNR